MASERIDAEELIRAAGGSTVYTIDRGDPNRVLGLDGANVVVGTKQSPGGQPVPIVLVQQAADMLTSEGEIRVHPDALGHRRSSFVGALLATHPSAVALIKPQRVRLRATTELRPLLERALAIVPQARPSKALTKTDPIYPLFVGELRDAVASIVGDERSYKTQGSVGRGNWAETPWVSVFDLNVTDTATRGYYLVYLFRRDGAAVTLSLNQGTTAVFNVARRGFEDVLLARASSYAGYLRGHDLAGLELGRLDLGGGRPPLTPGYEAGNVVGITYARDAIPSDDVLVSDLQRLLGLYRTLVEGIDEVRAGDEDAPPDDPQQHEEARRWRWHKRAEGRNRTAVAAAKRYYGYRCQGCDLDFEGLFGAAGKRCIDAHHVVPFAELGERPRLLNPVDDFAVVCANCHRLLHSRTPPLTVAQLRTLLSTATS